MAESDPTHSAGPSQRPELAVSRLTALEQTTRRSGPIADYARSAGLCVSTRAERGSVGLMTQWPEEDLEGRRGLALARIARIIRQHTHELVTCRFPSFERLSASSPMAQGVDHQRKCGRGLAPAWIVEVIPGPRRAPLAKKSHETTLFFVGPPQILRHAGVI